MDLFLIAHIAGRPIAIAGAQVESVVDLGHIVVVPGAERAVRGLAALRSRVVTVIDTGVALGLAPMPPEARRAVITKLDGHNTRYSSMRSRTSRPSPISRSRTDWRCATGGPPPPPALSNATASPCSCWIWRASFPAFRPRSASRLNAPLTLDGHKSRSALKESRNV